MFEVEIDWDQNRWVVWASNIVSGSEGSVFTPICFFEVPFGDISFSPPVDVFGGGGSQGEV